MIASLFFTVNLLYFSSSHSGQPIIGNSAAGRAAVERVASGEAPPIMSSGSVSMPPSNVVNRNHPPTSPLSNNAGGSPGLTVDAGSALEPGIGEVEDEALAEALALLASAEPSVASDAIGTLVKLIANLCEKFSEEKFHKVRLANKAFEKKVGTVPGGLELMAAAGFQLTSDDTSDETVFVYPMVPEPEPGLLEALVHLRRLQVHEGQ